MDTFFVNFLILFVLLPCKLLIFCWLCSFYLYIYKLIFYEKYLKYHQSNLEVEFWDKPTKQIARIFYFFGRIFYDYEADLDKIPDKGSGVIVMYHGLTACDMGCLFSKVLLEKGRRLHITVDNMIFNVPGFETLLQAMGAMKQNRKKCVELLERGELVAIYPGGAKEFFFSDNNYKIFWENRKGFARIALETKSKIIPMFTKNSREIHGFLRLAEKKFIYQCYEKYKWPFGIIIWGWFPVKMKTYSSEPIEFSDEYSLDELVNMVSRKSIECLIEKHQKRPGSVRAALKERFLKY